MIDIPETKEGRELYLKAQFIQIDYLWKRINEEINAMFFKEKKGGKVADEALPAVKSDEKMGSDAPPQTKEG